MELKDIRQHELDIEAIPTYVWERLGAATADFIMRQIRSGALQIEPKGGEKA